MADDNTGAAIAVGLFAAALGGVALYLGLKGTSGCKGGYHLDPGAPGCCPDGAHYDAPSNTCLSDGTPQPGGGGPSCGGRQGCFCTTNADCTGGFTCGVVLNQGVCFCDGSIGPTGACQPNSGGCVNCPPPSTCVGTICQPPLPPSIPPGCSSPCGPCGCQPGNVCPSFQFAPPFCYAPCGHGGCPPDQVCDQTNCGPYNLGDNCGTCVQAFPGGWNITGLTIQMLENVHPVVPGGPIDAQICWTDIGPGGAVQVGFQAGYDLIPGVCGETFTYRGSVVLEPHPTPTATCVTTLGLVWDTPCLLCSDPFGQPGFNVNAFVIAGGATWWGPIEPDLIVC